MSRGSPVTAELVITRDDEQIAVTVEGTYYAGEPQKLTGHPDTWHDGEPAYAEVESAKDEDGRPVELTSDEEKRAAELLCEAEVDGEDFDEEELDFDELREP